MISTGVDKAFNKTHHLFIIKNSQYLEIAESFLNLIRNIYKKLTTNSLLNSEKLGTFIPRSDTKQEFSFLPVLST